jgi:hypothetical protein
VHQFFLYLLFMELSINLTSITKYIYLFFKVMQQKYFSNCCIKIVTAVDLAEYEGSEPEYI